jgi:hypothetical protein
LGRFLFAGTGFPDGSEINRKLVTISNIPNINLIFSMHVKQTLFFKAPLSFKVSNIKKYVLDTIRAFILNLPLK